MKKLFFLHLCSFSLANGSTQTGFLLQIFPELHNVLQLWSARLCSASPGEALWNSQAPKCRILCWKCPKDSQNFCHVNPLPLTLQLQGLFPLSGHLLAVLMEHNGKMPMDKFQINLSWLCTLLVHYILELVLWLKFSGFWISVVPVTRVGAGASPCQLSVTSTLAPNRCRVSLSLFFLMPAFTVLVKPILGKEICQW